VKINKENVVTSADLGSAFIVQKEVDVVLSGDELKLLLPLADDTEAGRIIADLIKPACSYNLV
jgi:hypothetical protein